MKIDIAIIYSIIILGCGRVFGCIFNIESAKNKIYFMLMSNHITYEDIDRLSNYSLYELQELERQSYKNRVLISIYMNPYLLCNDDLINLNNFNFDIISKLINKRYEEELCEYNKMLNNNEISYIEYCNNITYLNKLYFPPSIIGRKVGASKQSKILKKTK